MGTSLTRRLFRVLGRTSSNARQTPVGKFARVTELGRIWPGELGEVAVELRGGIETYYALDADEGVIEPGEEVVVVDHPTPRVVLVARVGG